VQRPVQDRLDVDEELVAAESRAAQRDLVVGCGVAGVLARPVHVDGSVDAARRLPVGTDRLVVVGAQQGQQGHVGVAEPDPALGPVVAEAVRFHRRHVADVVLSQVDDRVRDLDRAGPLNRDLHEAGVAPERNGPLSRQEHLDADLDAGREPPAGRLGVHQQRAAATADRGGLLRQALDRGLDVVAGDLDRRPGRREVQSLI